MTYARGGRDAGVVTPRSVPPLERRHTTLARAVGAIGLIVLTALLFWMLTDDSFRVSDASVTFRGLAHADEADVREHLTELDRGPNVFRLRASEIVGELSTLTEVDDAYATVTVPAQVSVRLDERDPVFIWSNGAVAWLVDEEGMLFAPAEDEAAAEDVADLEDASEADPAADPDAATDIDADARDVARAALPVVEDGRLPAQEPTVGTRLEAADLAVMRQLLAITPELLGSRAQDLFLRVDKQDGYVLGSRDFGWRALFGHYTPTVQPPAVIPGQVQCLQWLLGTTERRLEQVRLAISDEACGTFTEFDVKKPKGN